MTQADEPVDDGTLVVRRRAAASGPAPTDDDDLDATRVSGRAGTEAPDAGLRHAVVDVDADTGSTMIVRRESRRRAEAAARVADLDIDLTVAGTGARPAAATVAADVPAPLGRLATASRPDDVVYARRDDGPAVATRTSRAPRAPQVYIDTAAAQATARRRARSRALAVVALVGLVVVGSVAAIVLLALTG